jgi:hypothetical protein
MAEVEVGALSAAEISFRFGYFAGRELAPGAPLLIMGAPALHVHPATDILLRYTSPEIEWTLLGIDERWRRG